MVQCLEKKILMLFVKYGKILMDISDKILQKLQSRGKCEGAKERRNHMKSYKALQIAQYIINHEFENSRPVSNLRLQKLLYYVQLYFLMCTGQPCFSDRVEAWDFGPVVPNVYHQYKRFGSMIIQEVNDQAENGLDTDDRQLIDQMLDKCSYKTTRELVEISHQQSPWRKAYNNPLSNEITMNSIREFISKISNAK